MSEYNLSQLISDDTHFTQHSSSLLDLILVRNKENILMSSVVDPLIPEQVRYLCPVMALLKFTPPRASSFKRKIWYYKLADYNKFRFKYKLNRNLNAPLNFTTLAHAKDKFSTLR